MLEDAEARVHLLEQQLMDSEARLKEFMKDQGEEVLKSWWIIKQVLE